VKQLARRDALQAVVGLAAAAAVGTVAGRHGSAHARTALDAVPETADAVVHADVDALRRDGGMRTMATAALQQRRQYVSAEPNGYRDVDALLSDVEADLDTDPSKVHRATVFGDVGGDGDDLFGGYAGVVFRAELSADDVKSGIENLDDIDLSKIEKSGTVVYEPETDGGPWVGALDADRVVVGTEAAVSDAVDVASGETAAVGDPLRGAYGESREAPVRFASRLPGPSRNAAVPTAVNAGGRSVDITPLDHVTTLAGAVYRDDDVRGLETTLSAADPVAANDVARVVRRLRDRVESELRDRELADIVGDIAVDRDGATVTTSVSRTVDELETLVEDGGASY